MTNSTEVRKGIFLNARLYNNNLHITFIDINDSTFMDVTYWGEDNVKSLFKRLDISSFEEFNKKLKMDYTIYPLYVLYNKDDKKVEHYSLEKPAPDPDAYGENEIDGTVKEVIDNGVSLSFVLDCGNGVTFTFRKNYCEWKNGKPDPSVNKLSMIYKWVGAYNKELFLGKLMHLNPSTYNGYSYYQMKVVD